MPSPKHKNMAFAFKNREKYGKNMAKNFQNMAKIWHDLKCIKFNINACNNFYVFISLTTLAF